ncbi:hypothetical protein CGZ98_03505 [Enemella evansiae]|uniref:nuclear transport factor 2 family protein n=1 Tax=Enemella evansiae TaxID=2016499 RepID=UPI000B975F27|nr:nuclear transport factor 2 family protein [Enemella evansiae]OYO15486.1 hypothetical protein CGZ98_03505 [Enemella evansiae]
MPVSPELYLEVQQFYAHQMPLLEERRLDELIETFTPDCTLEHIPFGWKFEGREPLLAEMLKRRGDPDKPLAGPVSARQSREEDIAYYDGLVYRYWFTRMRVEDHDGILTVDYLAIVSLTDAQGRVAFEPTTTVTDTLVRSPSGALQTASRVVTHDSARWADKTHFQGDSRD